MTIQKKKIKELVKNYTQYYVLEGEGGRFGICICKICGAAIVIDNDNAMKIHDEWHKKSLPSKK